MISYCSTAILQRVRKQAIKDRIPLNTCPNTGTFIGLLPSPLNSFPPKPHRAEGAGRQPMPLAVRSPDPEHLRCPPLAPQNFSPALRQPAAPP